MSEQCEVSEMMAMQSQEEEITCYWTQMSLNILFKSNMFLLLEQTFRSRLKKTTY